MFNCKGLNWGDYAHQISTGKKVLLHRPDLEEGKADFFDSNVFICIDESGEELEIKLLDLEPIYFN